MFTLSAFADEISPDPREQVAVLKACGVRHIEFRSIHKTNVLALSDEQIKEFKKLLDGEGFKLSAIGSPIGKFAIDAPFEPHLDKFKRAIELCGVFGTPNIRVFSYYPPGNDPNFDPANWPAAPRRGASAACARRPRSPRRHKVVLFHENEHRIYGDSPDRVADILTSVNSPALRAAYDAANYVVRRLRPGRRVGEDEGVHGALPHQGLEAGRARGRARVRRDRGHRRRQHRAQHPRRGRDGLQGLRHDGTAPPRRRADRRRHRPGPVPVRGRSVPQHSPRLRRNRVVN